MKSRLLFSNSASDSVDLSFIIPTYKRSVFLADAIQSILAQPHLPGLSVEIVIVNNDPNDKMEELIRLYKDANIRISFYSNDKNYGQVGNINQGITLSNGKYVAILHDDDMLNSNYLESLKPIIQSDRKYDCVVVSQYLLFEKYRHDFKHLLLNLLFLFRFLYRKKLTLIKPSFGVKAFVYNPPSCGVLFNKNSLVEFGLFKEKSGAAWDFVNFREFNEKHNVFLLHKYVGFRRVSTGMSNSVEAINDFRNDELFMVEQNSSMPFIKLFGKNLVAKRKGIKYLFGRFFAGCFYYLHNLDSLKNSPRKYYK